MEKPANDNMKTILKPAQVAWMVDPAQTSGPRNLPELSAWVAARFEPYPGWEFVFDGPVFEHRPIGIPVVNVPWPEESA